MRLKELREEICRYLKRRFNLEYDPIHETLITVGGSEAIDIGMRCMLNPGDEVLIPQPSYVSYVPCAVMADGVPKIIELKAENDFRLTPEEIREAVTDKTKLLVPFHCLFHRLSPLFFQETRFLNENARFYRLFRRTVFQIPPFRLCARSARRDACAKKPCVKRQNEV